MIAKEGRNPMTSALRTRFLSVLAWAFAMAGLLAAHAEAQPSLPSNFFLENPVPGNTFNFPVCMAFLPDGRLLVGEKRGTVWVVQDGSKFPVPFWTRDVKVLDNGDRGLLGIAVDPNFASNRQVYFLFTVDPDSNGVDDDDDAYARLERYQVSLANPNLVDLSTRVVLFGRNWTEGAGIGSSTHTVGALRWGIDGSLLVSVGDGAHFVGIDEGGRDPGMFGAGKTDPLEDIGAFRSQFLNSLDGKVLRINSVNGHGYSSNPYWDGNPSSIQSRVWLYGFRNPFRFCVRPGTGATDPAAGDPGTLLMSDVGWETWEELNSFPTGGGNAGWPCYESAFSSALYEAANPAHSDCSTIPNPAPHTPPIAYWHHHDGSFSSQPGVQANAVASGLFYTGTSYPSTYQGALFFGDFGQNWIQIAHLNGSDQLIDIVPFGTDMDAPVDFAAHPITKDVYYIAIAAQEVRRIWYGGGPPGNNPPVAVISATPNVGCAPQNVSFSSAGSSDPDSDPIVGYSWVFGDGSGSTAANPSHNYTQPGNYSATLTVTDSRGGQGTKFMAIVITESCSFPTTNVLDDFNRANGPLGPNWVDPVNGLEELSVLANQMSHACCGAASPTWAAAPYGPDQEAYIRFKALAPEAEGYTLTLKMQGPDVGNFHVEVHYDDGPNQVTVISYDGTYVTHGAPIPVTYGPNDQFGARAYRNGTIAVYKNGAVMGTRSVASWAYYQQGGYIGMALNGYAKELDDWGGGTLVVSGNTPPVGSIEAPLDSTFFVAGESVSLVANAVDQQQLASALDYDWFVHLHHNTHTHPSQYTPSGMSTSFLPENHEDGTGVWYEVEMRVTDGGNLADTVKVSIFPEVDLEPSTPVLFPNPPEVGGFALYRFLLTNHGRMPSPSTRWRMRGDNQLLAEGDTTVAAQSSLMVQRYLPTTLSLGPHTLRVTVDTLAQAVETDESNNAANRAIEVVPNDDPTGTPDTLPLAFALTAGFPNPSPGRVAFGLELPREAAVRLTVHDVQGRQVWTSPARTYQGGRWTLGWTGVREDGSRAAPGLYLVRIRAGSQQWVRRVALVR